VFPVFVNGINAFSPERAFVDGAVHIVPEFVSVEFMEAHIGAKPYEPIIILVNEVASSQEGQSFVFGNMPELQILP
jgi:hypothetical protein